MSDNMQNQPEIIACSGQPVRRRKNDLLAIPLLGPMLKSPWLLIPFRVLVLLVFAYAIYFGLAVPEAENNHVTTGIFWGLFWPFFMLVSVATLGPIICTACPHGFIGKYLSRWGLKKTLPKKWRNPFIGLATMLVAYWLVYYAFVPFKSPWVSAWFFLLLTVAAIILFLVFDGMAYCRYFCPLGAVRAAFGKLGFTWLSSYEKSCEGCKSFDCAKACDYKLSPFNFDKNGSMNDCTLCMDCAQACSAIRWRLTKPSFSLLKPIRKMRSVDVWLYILLLGVISITMRFHHGLSRSAIADKFIWTRTGRWLEQQFPTLVTNGIDTVGLVALALGTALTVVVSLGGFWLGAKILRQSYRRVFQNLGYALAPLMVVGGLSHVGEFYFLHYYHDIANATNQMLGLTDELVAPLAKRGEPWLHRFKLFQYLAVIWCYYLFYRRLQWIDTEAWRKCLAYPAVSAMVTTYLGLLFYSGYVFATYGAAVHHHH